MAGEFLKGCIQSMKENIRLLYGITGVFCVMVFVYSGVLMNQGVNLKNSLLYSGIGILCFVYSTAFGIVNMSYNEKKDEIKNFTFYYIAIISYYLTIILMVLGVIALTLSVYYFYKGDFMSKNNEPIRERGYVEWPLPPTEGVAPATEGVAPATEGVAPATEGR